MNSLWGFGTANCAGSGNIKPAVGRQRLWIEKKPKAEEERRREKHSS